MGRPELLLAGWMTIGSAHAAGAQVVPKPPIDLSDLAERLELTDGGVRRWLDRLGAKDASRAETLVALDSTGKILIERRGGESSVRVDPELDDLLLRPGAGVVMIHNHPANVGLSLADLRHLYKPGVAAIVAIGHDGSVFIASAGPRFDHPAAADLHYPVALAEIRDGLRREWPAGRLSVEAGDAHTSHLITLAFARARVVQYWFKLRGGSLVSYQETPFVFNRIAALGAARLKR